MYGLCRGVPDGAKSVTACIMSVRVVCEIILAGFNLAVSTTIQYLYQNVSFGPL